MLPFKKLLIEPKQAIYFEIPKVACTTINYVLIQTLIRPNEKLDVGKIHSDESLPRIWGPVPKPLNDYFKFAFVRDPFTRLRSCFRDKIKPLGTNQAGLYEDGLYVPFQKFGKSFWPGMDFDSFANSVCEIPDQDADPHFRSQSSFICDSGNRLVVDFVGRFESLATDLAKLMNRFSVGANQYVIPHINKQSYDQKDDCAPASKALVRRRFEADFEQFGYEPS